MSDAKDAKTTPSATQSASSGLRLAKDETNLVMNPKGDPSLEAPKTSDKSAGLTESASNAAASAAETASTTAAGVKDSIFSMFGGGGPKEKKVEAEDEDAKNEPSGSSKAKKVEDDEEKAPEEEADVHFEPVVRLTEKVETKTNEESEEAVFKMRAKLYKVHKDDSGALEWKERGTGDVKLLKHKSNQKTRLVMRREKTFKVCANHYVTPDMKLTPSAGNDRSWVWNVAADVSEGEPEACTLAIRFSNSDNANLFKEAFIKAQQENEKLFGGL